MEYKADTLSGCTFALHSHEKPSDPNDPLSNQKLKERYYGTKDPVADKLLKHASEMPQLTAPEDKTVTSLYVGGVEEEISEKDLRCIIRKANALCHVVL